MVLVKFLGWGTGISLLSLMGFTFNQNSPALRTIDNTVPAAVRQWLVAALMKLNQPANNKLLQNWYNSTELVIVNHDRHLAPMKEALQRAGFRP
jgi:hypothetical protein